MTISGLLNMNRESNHLLSGVVKGAAFLLQVVGAVVLRNDNIPDLRISSREAFSILLELLNLVETLGDT